ncbi:hypothetical protein IV203_031599 [Nitzschia inconspicua]|uniref:Transmembrane protein n=1 Tax=Nitzschia inconspicua TaxID=303405 RepID=A0A9K3LXG0_9STRA|nr:hypothetical protein IV203_031599 [Nitzschia inconspicua]
MSAYNYLDRLKWWVILLIGSIFLLVSYIERDTEDIAGQSLVIASIILALIGMVSSLMPRREMILIFRLESVIIWIMTILWGSIAVFSRVLPTNSEEAIEANVIAFANRFFFSYLCLIASVLLLANWFKNEVQADDSVTSTQWILLCASSFVVMINAIGFRDRLLDLPVSTGNETMTSELTVNVTINSTLPNTNNPLNLTLGNITGITNTTDTIRTSFCDASDAFSCHRVEFAIVLGGLSAGCALATALSSKSCSPVGCVVDLALLLFVAWCCGIAFLTFAQGPGFTLGSIYFGSFVSLFLCLDILLVALSQQAAIEKERDNARRDQFRQQLANEYRSQDAEEFMEVSLDDVLTASYHLGRRKSRRSTAHEFDRRVSRKSSNYRNMSASIFESVGAWRGSTIFNMDGERIPSDVANLSGIEDNESYIETRDIHRLELWIILLILSIVCLVAIQQLLPEAGSRDAIENVALAMPALSVVAASTGMIACGRPNRSARFFEFCQISLAIGCWTVNLICRSSIVDFGDLPVRTGAIVSANVFCSSWGAFVCSILLGCCLLKASIEVIDWILLAVFASALVASSMLFFQEEIYIESNDVSVEGRVCDVLESYKCKRIRLGQYLGLVTSLMSLLMGLFHQRISLIFRLSAGVLLVVGWGCAAAYITFGSGHGRDAGSVYMEVWAGFFLSLDIMNSSIVAIIRQRYERHVGQDRPNESIVDDREQSEQPVAGDMKYQIAQSKEQDTLELPDWGEAVTGNDDSLNDVSYDFLAATRK